MCSSNCAFCFDARRTTRNIPKDNFGADMIVRVCRGGVYRKVWKIVTWEVMPNLCSNLLQRLLRSAPTTPTPPNSFFPLPRSMSRYYQEHCQQGFLICVKFLNEVKKNPMFRTNSERAKKSLLYTSPYIPSRSLWGNKKNPICNVPTVLLLTCISTFWTVMHVY